MSQENVKILTPEKIKDEQRLKKEIYGQLFRGEILNQFYNLCESSQQEDYEAALEILSKKNKKMSQENVKDLLEKIIKVLQSSRLTINFDFSKLNDISGKSSEVLNCFAYKQKPNEIYHYNVGRAKTEEEVFELNKLFDTSKYQKFGRYSTADGDQTKKSTNFQWTSRPCYAALDFLENPFGGAPMYGKSFIVLKDYVKHNSTYSPYDTYSPPVLSWGAFKNKISTFFHFPRLIRYCQNDWLKYNCLESLINKANGEDITSHRNYGKSVGNYIETHIYSRISFSRDIKQICLSKEEFYSHPISQQKKILEKIKEINSYQGSSFIIFIKEDDIKKQEKVAQASKLLLKQERLTILENDIVNLEKKKINKILNFVIRIITFNKINKNKKIEQIINDKKNEIKRLLLEKINTDDMTNNVKDSNNTHQKRNVFDNELTNNEESHLPLIANHKNNYIKNKTILI